MSFRQYLQELFDDMRDCAEQIAADRDAFFRRFPLVPPNISIGDGRRIFVSEKSLVAIQKIARLASGGAERRRTRSRERPPNALQMEAVSPCWRRMP